MQNWPKTKATAWNELFSIPRQSYGKLDRFKIHINEEGSWKTLTTFILRIKEF